MIRMTFQKAGQKKLGGEFFLKTPSWSRWRVQRNKKAIGKISKGQYATLFAYCPLLIYLLPLAFYSATSIFFVALWVGVSN